MSQKLSANKRFSFVIPTYQSKNQLGNTLEVLNWQRGIAKEDYEVVVVDDGSTDGTEEHVKTIHKEYAFKYIYVDRTPDSSRAKTRNAGIMAAEGEIVIFIDADMLVREDYLSQADRYFKEDQDILLVGHRVVLTEAVVREDILKGRDMFQDDKFKIKGFDNFELRHALFFDASFNSRRNRYPWIHAYTCNMAVRRELLDRAGYFDEDFKGWGLEDLELGYRLYKCGAKIITGIKIEAFHQPHSYTVTTAKKTEKEREAETDANTFRFIQKHPEALPVSEQDILAYFRGNAASIKLEIEDGIKSEIEINFRNSSELEAVKAQILEISSKTDYRAVVYDYVEETDLDIWIQLLEGLESVPKYYPMLRGQHMRTIVSSEPKIVGYKIQN